MTRKQLPALPFMITAAAGLAWSACLCGGAPADAPRIDLNAIAAKGARTAEQLRTAPATWVVRNTLGSGPVMEFSVVRAGEKQRTVVTLVQGGQRREMVRITARDGLWYATDRNGSYRYRPYEMPAETPFVYFCMQRSEPVFVVPGSEILGDKLDSADGRTITFRQALSPAEARQAESLVSQMNAMARDSGEPLPADVRATADALKDALDNGTPVRVDLTTGQVIEYGSVKLKSRVVEFRLLPEVNDREFAVDDRKWQDYSDDPTAGNPDDLAMIAQQPGMQPGSKNYDLDGRLIDVTTGRFRRLPFPGGVVMPGCFLRGRRSVLVTGMKADSPAVRPYRLDLRTGECQPIGGALFDSGFTLFGDLSPDGKTAAFIRKSSDNKILDVQVCLVDVTTGEARELGKPRDTAAVNWTADGQHLVLLDRQYETPTSPEKTSVAVMDMRGNVAVLRRGDAPVVLADRKTILYEDGDSHLWHTCDLQGRDDKLFADGLKGYGFPSPGPDGKRILMMRFTPGALPTPVVLRIGDSEGKPVTTTGGLWGLPAWR